MSLPCAAHAGFVYLCQPGLFFLPLPAMVLHVTKKFALYVATIAFAFPSCALFLGARSWLLGRPRT